MAFGNGDGVGCMVTLGSKVYLSLKRSATIKVISAFSLDCLYEFSISHIINKVLSGKYFHIVREH